jgi:anti-sigma factor RsiW
MNCERYEAQIIAYMDGSATPAERSVVEAHMAECAACRARVEEFRGLWTVLDEAPVVEVSPAFDARLHERMAAETRPGWFEWLVPQPRLAMAVGLLLVLGVWIGSVDPPGPPHDVASGVKTDEEFQMIRDLQVLEDYDVLAGLDALSEAPKAKQNAPSKL